MKELESIVQRMMDAGEPESKIREAVRIYKENQKGKAQDSTVDPTMSQSNMGSQSVDGSLESQDDDVSWFDQTWFGRGVAAASTTGEATDLMSQDFSNIDMESIQEFMKAKESEAKAHVPSERMGKFQKKYVEEGKTWSAFFRGVRDQPGLLPELFVQSLGTQVGTLIDSPGASLSAGAAGAGVGAAVGAVPGAVAGFMGGLATSMEAALTFGELIETELKEQGKEFTDENIKALLEGPKGNSIRNKSIGRGLTIGAIEGLSGGLAGKAAVATKGAVAATRGAKTVAVAAGAAGVAVEAVGGATGEVLGRVVAGQEMDAAEIGFEAITGTVTAPINILTALKSAKQPTYRLNGGDITYKEMKEFVETADDIDVAKASIQIKDDFTGVEKLANEKQNKAQVKSQVDDKITDDKDVEKLIKLDALRREAKANLKKEGINQVPGAEEALASVEASISSIINKYKGAADVAITQQAADVRKAVRENNLQDTIDFLQKNKNYAGKDVVIADDSAAAQVAHDKAVEEFNIKNPDNKIDVIDVTKADGFIVGDVIVVNKDIAGRTGAINVGAHELLHGIMGKHMKTLDDAGKIKLGKSFMDVLTKKQDAAVRKRLKENYKLEGDSVFASEEIFTAFSDAITKNEITFNEGVFDKLKNVIQKIFSLNGYAKEFANGRQVYNFLKDYQKSVAVGGEISTRAQRLSSGGTTATDTKASRSTPLEAIKALIPKNVKTQEDYYKLLDDPRVAERIFDGRKLAPVIEAYIRSRSTSSEMANENIKSVKNRLVNFDPAKERADGTIVGPEGFGEFIFANANFGKLDAATSLFKKGEIAKKTTTIDTKEAKELEDTSTATEVEDKSKARNLRDFDIEVEDGLVNAEIEAEVEALLEKNPDDIEVQMEKLILGDIRKSLDGIIGKIAKDKKTGKRGPTAEYEAFIRNEYLEVVQSLGMETIRTAYRPWFESKKIRTEKYKGISPKTGKVTNYVKDVFENKTNKREYIRWFLEGNERNLTERRTALIRRIARRKAKIATDNYIEANSKNLEKVAEAKLRMVSRAIEDVQVEKKSFDSVKFSIGFEQEFNSILSKLEQRKKNKKGKPTGTWYFKKKFEKNAPRDEKGNIKSFPNKGIIYEQAFANYFVKMVKRLGINEDNFEVVSTVASEKGGMADFIMKIFGDQENHEIKASMTAFMGSVSISNFSNGKISLATDVHNEMLSEIDMAKFKKGYMKTIDFANKRIRELNKTRPKGKKYDIINPDVISGEPQYIPKEIYNDKDFPNKVFYFLEGKDASVISRHYKGKGVNSISFVNTGIKGSGEMSFRLNDDSVLALDMLDAETVTNFTFRNGGTKIVKGDEMIALSLGVQFKITKLNNDPKTTLDVTDDVGFQKATKKYALLSKSPINTQTIGKAINFSRSTNSPTKGITVLDFDDTLATSKSLIRFTKPGEKVVYNASPKSLKDLGARSGVIYLATDKKEADAYAESNRGDVREFVVDESNITSEAVVLKEMQGQGIDTSEGLLYELIDSRFEDYFIGKKNVDKVFNALRKKGIKAFRYEDGSQVSSSNTESIAVIDKSALNERGTLNAEQYASTYQELTDLGYKWDFSEFNKVVDGKTAPLFNKAMKLQGKFGPENMFVLTARPAEAAPAIFAFLQANGLNIPLKNITGLANSTAEAKALWMVDKVSDGYNDFYFADDALQNVQAVDNILEQFDVKRKVQQARVKFSNSMNENFNNILESLTGIESKKRFDSIKGRKRGESKGKFRFFIPPSHEDFVGLLYNFMGKGKEGNKHRDFLEQALVRPINRANREYDTARQSIANDYKALNKQFEDVKAKLTEKTKDGDFTNEDAIRIYLWDKHGHNIPGLSPVDQKNLVELVNSDQELRAYAETLNIISKQETYVNPTDGWNAGDIRMDLDDATGRVGRAQYFAEFNENAEVIFSTENLNKIEAGYGKGVRVALEDILYRIKTGRNRPSGSNETVNKFMNFLNGSVGTVMFFNMRSALLQQMSIVNYINFADNNIFAAAKAFANQKQYWADFAFIFNSDMLKQRRGGIQTDVNGAELAASLRKSKNPSRVLISKLLELGFLPTQIGDNIAIATGGAAYYRNTINKYVKQGMSIKEAEAAAFTDFQDITQSTQQSARPDMVSMQQASVLGKVILNFQNVTSQFNRLGKKAFQDIYNRRITKPNSTQMQSDISNAARITYYFAVQNMIFYTLQTALFAMMFDDDEEDNNNLFLKKKERLINGSIDSVLRGAGVIGGVVATLKNTAIAFARQRDVNYNPDESAVVVEALNLSPVIGIKARQIVNAEKTLNYNKKIIDEMETFDIDNPQWSAVTNYVQTFTNLPLNRLYNKTQNVRQALNNEHSAWERSLMFLGWSQYNLDIKNEKMEQIKKDVKGKKKKKTNTRSKFKPTQRVSF